MIFPKLAKLCSKLLLFYCVFHNTATYGQWEVTAKMTKSPEILKGTVIGSNGSWSGGTTDTKYKVFDDDPTTYFDAATGNGQWAGKDLGAVYTINFLKISPRVGLESRMQGGKFQISTDSAFTNPTTFYTMPNYTNFGNYYILNTSSTAPTNAQYIRYLSPDNGYCNIAEMKIYGFLLAQPNTSSWTGNINTAGYKIVGSNTSNMGLTVDSSGNVIADQDIVDNGTLYSASTKSPYNVIPDYVFDSTYSLMPALELEKYIKKNKHLPEVPSDDEYKKRGSVDLQELNLLLLKKTEELTLHIIELEKTTTLLQSQILLKKQKKSIRNRNGSSSKIK